MSPLNLEESHLLAQKLQLLLKGPLGALQIFDAEFLLAV